MCCWKHDMNAKFIYNSAQYEVGNRYSKGTHDKLAYFLQMWIHPQDSNALNEACMCISCQVYYSEVEKKDCPINNHTQTNEWVQIILYKETQSNVIPPKSHEHLIWFHQNADL